MLVFGAQDSNKVGEKGTEEVLIVFKFFFSYSCVTLKLHFGVDKVFESNHEKTVLFY